MCLSREIKQQRVRCFFLFSPQHRGTEVATENKRCCLASGCPGDKTAVQSTTSSLEITGIIDEGSMTSGRFVPRPTNNVPWSHVLHRVPEAQLKSIVWQTLQAVNFCHKHNVSMFYQCYVD